MNYIIKHVTKKFIAGLIALLPIASTLLAVALVERSIATTGIKDLAYYFPGLGIILAVVLLYLVGVIATSFIGKFIWKRIDIAFEHIPTIGEIYKAIKEILGYDTGDEAVFKAVVLYKNNATDSEEIGLVTNEFQDDAGRQMSFVFLPNSPTPTSGKLVLIESNKLRKINISSNEALKTILAVGKVDLKFHK